MNFSCNYLQETALIAEKINPDDIRKIVAVLARVKKQRGRIFFIGMGGSAANCSHAVNDFRKIAEIEAYTPTDNVPEFSARINDDGLESSFSRWLHTSKMCRKDCLFIMSVGGGSIEEEISKNIIVAISFAKGVGAAVVGVVGRDGGYTAKKADVCAVIPVVAPERITPHTEAFQSVICHLIVSHPDLKSVKTKWESLGFARRAL